MRSPAERRLAYQVELARAMRMAEGYVPDQMWSLRVRKRWPMRLMCEMSCGPGWHDLVVAVNELIDQEAEPEFRFTQIKEKFGQLRMYWHGADPSGRIDQLIEAAEELSASMCEGGMMLGTMDRGMKITVVPRDDGSVGVVTSGQDCAQGPGMLTSGGD